METNHGTIAFREPESINAKRTIIVTGIGRSGTSAMAMAMYEMGVPRLGKLRRHTHEDFTIGQLVRDRNADDLKAEIGRRNDLHDVWGFKWTNLYHFPQLLKLFRNPVFIVMSRDLVSVAIRNGMCEDIPGESGEWLTKASQWQNQLIQFAIHAPYPVLLVSYEKLIQKPHQTLDAVSQFTGLYVSEESLLAITPECPEYISGLQWSLEDPESWMSHEDASH